MPHVAELTFRCYMPSWNELHRHANGLFHGSALLTERSKLGTCYGAGTRTISAASDE